VQESLCLLRTGRAGRTSVVHRVAAFGINGQSGIGNAPREFLHLTDRRVFIVRAVKDERQANNLIQAASIQIAVTLWQRLTARNHFGAVRGCADVDVGHEARQGLV
jgi:hypothetical protein